MSKFNFVADKAHLAMIDAISEKLGTTKSEGVRRAIVYTFFAISRMQEIQETSLKPLDGVKIVDFLRRTLPEILE